MECITSTRNTLSGKCRAQVIKEWLSGNTRDEIAQNNKIGAGSVSNIINDWKKGLDNTDYYSMRELSIFLKKEGITLNDLGPLVRLNNYHKSQSSSSSLRAQPRKKLFYCP